MLPGSVYYKFCCTCTCFSFLSLCPYLPISSVLAANQSQYKETDLGLITIFICKSVLFHLTKVKVKAFFVTVLLSSCDVLSLSNSFVCRCVFSKSRTLLLPPNTWFNHRPVPDVLFSPHWIIVLHQLVQPGSKP